MSAACKAWHDVLREDMSDLRLYEQSSGRRRNAGSGIDKTVQQYPVVIATYAVHNTDTALHGTLAYSVRKPPDGMECGLLPPS